MKGALLKSTAKEASCTAAKSTLNEEYSSDLFLWLLIFSPASTCTEQRFNLNLCLPVFLLWKKLAKNEVHWHLLEKREREREREGGFNLIMLIMCKFYCGWCGALELKWPVSQQFRPFFAQCRITCQEYFASGQLNCEIEWGEVKILCSCLLFLWGALVTRF